jgi:hypothetical protein
MEGPLVTLAERIAPLVRGIAGTDVARKIRADKPTVADEASATVAGVVDVIARAADDLTKSIDRTAGQAKKDAARVGSHLGGTASDALGSVQSAAGDAASKVEDVVLRLRKDLPTDRLTSLVTNLERELPTTDKDRYDRAFARGWTRARTAFVGVGLLTGALAGIAGAFLLDPAQGPRRRATLRERFGSLGRQAGGRATWAMDRAKGMAYERGILRPGTDSAGGHGSDDALRRRPQALVGVMDVPAPGGGSAMSDASVQETPVMPLADGPVTDPASIEREPMAAPEGGYVGGTAAAEGEAVTNVDVTGLDGDRQSETLNR